MENLAIAMGTLGAERWGDGDDKQGENGDPQLTALVG